MTTCSVLLLFKLLSISSHRDRVHSVRPTSEDERIPVTIGHPDMDPTSLRNHSAEEAQKAFEMTLQSLQHTADNLGIPMPPYAKVSGKFQVSLRRCTIWY